MGHHHSLATVTNQTQTNSFLRCWPSLETWRRHGFKGADETNAVCPSLELWPNKSPQQRRPSSQQHANEASSQDIPESQPIPDSAPENPSHEIEVGDHMVYNDEMHSINLPGETENTSHEFEVETDEIHTQNIPSETETPFVEFEIGNDEVHHRNLPRNLENPSHEVDVGHEDVQLVQVPFIREQRAVQQPPTSKKQKTLGLKRQVKTKHVATRKYRTSSLCWQYHDRSMVFWVEYDDEEASLLCILLGLSKSSILDRNGLTLRQRRKEMRAARSSHTKPLSVAIVFPIFNSRGSYGQGSRSLHHVGYKARDLLYMDYTHINKKAKDLLYRDYQTDRKFTITTYSLTGVAITSTGSKKGDLFFGDVNTQLKNKNITIDIKVDTNSNVFTTITIDEDVPGHFVEQLIGRISNQHLRT
nr:mitochondrial outer membrane protein porin of 34 kDa [Ipomoea batatas]